MGGIGKDKFGEEMKKNSKLAGVNEALPLVEVPAAATKWKFRSGMLFVTDETNPICLAKPSLTTEPSRFLIPHTCMHHYKMDVNVSTTQRTFGVLVKLRSESLAIRVMDSDLRRSFSRESRRFWCMVKNNRFLYFWFSILNRFSWFMRFSKCRFFLQRDRLADSRFDCIRLSFLSCEDRTARFEPCEPDPDPDPGLAGSLTRENSSSISLGVNMVSRTGKYED
ncbi:hypothetical protein JHK85_039990 [Glycine max]|nr:hypothetical protein JHK86_039411 [Glycine max]KAG4965015.1 hypothetical protein JHK85_039990 [Glycine max]